jgi:uncharacterized protein
MKKIELEIVALTHSVNQTHSYAVVLGEVNGLRRIPIIIGGYEAQAIAVALERMKPNRPLTHDLMKNFMMAFQVELTEVVINHLSEGIFYSQLVCIGNNEVVEIDSRTSDAIAMAVRFGCPIFTYDTILDQAGILMDDNESQITESINNPSIPSMADTQSVGSDLSNLSVTDINAQLEKALEDEDYMRAAKLRDELKKRKG